MASALCWKLQDIRLRFQSTINNIALSVQVSLRLRWRWWYDDIIWSITRQPHANRGWRADRMKEMRLHIPNPLICLLCGLESQSERISLPSLLPLFQQLFDLPVNRRRPVSASLCQNEILSTPKKSWPTLRHPGLSLSWEGIPAVIPTCVRMVILTNYIDVHYLELYTPS